MFISWLWWKNQAYFTRIILMWWVQGVLTSWVPGYLKQEWVFALPELGCALCGKTEAFCGLGLEEFFQIFDGSSGLFVGLLVLFLSQMSLWVWTASRGASLLDITTANLSTLSVLSWPQAEAHIMRKRTSLIFCLLDWQSCMGEGRWGSLGILQLLW